MKGGGGFATDKTYKRENVVKHALIILLAASALLAGCVVAPPQPPRAPEPPPREMAQPIASEVEEAKARIREKLVDPQSAEFTNIYVTRDARGNDFFGRAVCGHVNSKNRMGGYVGPRRFAVYGDQVGIWDERSEGRARSDAAIIRRWCQVRY